MKKGFNLEISSDLDYEGMVLNIVYIPKNLDFLEHGKKQSEIVYKQKSVAVLNQDKGEGNIEIKIYPPVNKNYWEFSYEEFIQSLKEAKELLIQVNKKS